MPSLFFLLQVPTHSGAGCGLGFVREEQKVVANLTGHEDAVKAKRVAKRLRV